MRAEPAEYSAHCALVPFTESAGKRVVQGFWNIIGCDEVGRIEKCFELLADSR